MTPASARQHPGSTWWESFAITDWGWTVPAFAAAFALLMAITLAPWLFTGTGVILGFALLSAVATATLRRDMVGALSAATLLRYTLVDATLIAFSVHPLAQLSQAATVFAGLHPRPMAPFGGLLLAFAFVCAFYATLGIAGHARKSRPGRRAVAAVVAVVAALLAYDGYRQFVEHARIREAREAGVTSYERAAGKKIGHLDRLQVGNSLHGFDNRVGAVALDREGRYLVSGNIHYYAGKDAIGLVRLLADGTLDRDFAAMPPGDPAGYAPSRMLVAPDGSIIINRPLPGSPAPASGLMRLRPDGAIDTAFRPDVALDPNDRAFIDNLEMLPDGSLLAISPRRFVQREQDSCLYRFDSSGARDRAFEAAAMRALYGAWNAKGPAVACSIHAFDRLASGQILVRGIFPSSGHRQELIRLNADGTQDPAYQSALGAEPVAFGLATQAGEYFAVRHVQVPGLKPAGYRSTCAKFGADGRPDPSFRLSADRIQRIEHVAMQPDGKLILAGSLRAMDYGAIIRVLPNGDPDPSFGGPAGVVRVDGFLTNLIVQSDGRIVIAGEFRSVTPASGSRVERYGIARLLPDGSLDPTFVPR